MGVRSRAARDERVRRALRVVTVLAAVGVCTLAALATPARAESEPAAWVWPLSGPPPVTRGFDPPAVRYGAGHRGVDLGGTTDQPVLAAGAGRISYAGLLAGRGVVVVVHGDLRTTYEPVRAEVGVGQVVQAGTPIGRLDAGHAGCAAQACLHWGLRRGEQYLDPLSLVGAGPVRLLPVPGTLTGQASGPVPAGAAGREQAGPAAPQHATAREQAPAPEPAAASGLDLRAAMTPTGALAAAALLAGVALLARPRPPRRPGGGAARAVAPGDVDRDAGAGPDRPTAPVLDLVQERARRGAAPW